MSISRFMMVPLEDFEDPLFAEPLHEYSRIEAWLDVVRRARAIEGGGLGRGQLQVSLSKLAEIWSWAVSKVQRFIQSLINAGRLRLVHPGDRATSTPAVYELLHCERYKGRPREIGADIASETAKPMPVVEHTRAAIQPLKQELKGLKEERTKEENENRERKPPPTPTAAVIEKPAGVCVSDSLSFFDQEFWPHYPRKENRDGARNAWRRLNPSPDQRRAILTDIERRQRSPEWNREGGRYIPFAVNYLTGRRWEDTPAATGNFKGDHSGTHSRDRGVYPEEAPGSTSERRTQMGQPLYIPM